jgi:hypothetical protein
VTSQCPDCFGIDIVCRTYRPMADQYWVLTMCCTCRWEDHRLETRSEAAARVMSRGA